jgi:polar amino acid transport system permease protein
MSDFEFIRENWLFIAGGLGQTLSVSIFSFLLAILLAWIVGTGQHSTILPIKALTAFYAAVIDGIPLVLQIFFVFLVLPQLGVALPGLWAGVLVLGIYYGVEISKTVWTGFASAMRSRKERLQSLIPPLITGLIAIIKDSAIVSVVTGFFHDVMWRASHVGREQFHLREAYLIAAIIYFVLITILSYVLKARNGRTLVDQTNMENTSLIA